MIGSSFVFTFVPSAISALQYGHCFTFASYLRGSPAMTAVAACRGAIRVRELHRLRDGVHVVGAVELHRLQVEVLEDVQRLQQRRSLAAEGVLVDGVSAVRRPGRLLDARVELREVAVFPRRVMPVKE